MFDKIKNLFKHRNVIVAEKVEKMIDDFDMQHINNNKAFDVTPLYLDGYEFAKVIHELFDPGPDYVPLIDTGNWENVNMIIAKRLVKMIKDNPSAWDNFRVG